jgi:group I intron endonuclease
MKTSGVYGWRNEVTGKWYVGSSAHIERRRATHLKKLSNGNHEGPKLLRAWRKYGSEAWDFVVLEKCDPVREILVAREQHWLDLYDSFRNGYNTLPTAGSCLGVKWTEERRRKTIASRIASGGWKHSEETKKLLRDMQRGVSKGPMSETQKRLLSKIKKEKGMPKSERQRIAKMARERVYTDEIRKNMAKAHEGYAMPETQKQRIAASNSGKPKSLEAVAKMLRVRQGRGVHFSKETCIKYGLAEIGVSKPPEEASK